MKKVIFVGWVNQGRAPVDGETTKNQHIIAVLCRYCRVTVLDFYKKKHHPWIYLQALWAFFTQPHATIILSTSAKNVYSMLKLFKRIGIHREIIHWVVGGNFGRLVKEGRFRADVFNYVTYNLVQCKGMITELMDAGVTNARLVSNFKAITYYPNIEQAMAKRKVSSAIHFVFLSRIMPSKGCDYLLEAIKYLNAKNYQDRFTVDFYGMIDITYQESYFDGIKQFHNVAYKGLLDLRSPAGYDTLAEYHAMLFPTIHPSEGFSGMFIDAFIAALPVLVSDWAYNSEIINNGKNGIIYASKDSMALAKVLEECILGQTDLLSMAHFARAEADRYCSENALSENYLKSIGLLS